MRLVRAVMLFVAALLAATAIVIVTAKKREASLPEPLPETSFTDDEVPYQHEVEVELPKEDVPIDSLSNKTLGWGPGTEVDDKNRPTGAITASQQYGSLDALFLMPDEDSTVYLTFDLGYENGYTASILDTLKDKNVRGVFFITKDYLNEAPELVERIITEGHVLGNHTVHHPSLPSLGKDEAALELTELHDAVKERFGYDMTLFRFPRGEFSERTLALVKELGYDSVFWSFAYVDWLTDSQPDTAASLQKLLSSLHDGAIYLLHTVSSTNAAILGGFIDGARAAGYEFGSFSPSGGEGLAPAGNEILSDKAVIGE